MSHHPTARPARSRRRARVAALGATAALALAVSACGSSDDSSSTTTTAAPDAASTTEAAGAASAENAVTVTSPGMSYEVSGTLQPGTATLTFRNDDDVAHMLAMARLQDGVTLDQVRTALDKGEEEAAKLLAEPPDQAVYGSPAPVGPGLSSTTTMVDLPAGHYALLCFFTTDDGTPHFQAGMVSELTVEGDEVTGTPDSDGTIELTDDAITLPDDFDGHGTFAVTNTGSAAHSMSIAKLDDGTTLDEYFQAVGQAQSSGKAMDVDGGVLDGGVDALLPDQTTYLTLDLEPGHYGYVSVEDANGPGMPAQHGEFDVS
ncbi:MAG: hypothetical protein R2746_15230 [Acidimicrobiales bacterium]